MSAANPNPMEISMVSVLIVENAGGGGHHCRDEGSKGFGSGSGMEDCGQVLSGEASRFQVPA
jgi:hypothetical protein